MSSFLQRSSQKDKQSNIGSPLVRSSTDFFSSKNTPQNPKDVFSQLRNFRNDTLRRAENSERASLLSIESPKLNHDQKKSLLLIGQSVPSSTKHSCSAIHPQSLTSLQIQQLSPKKSYIFNEPNNKQTDSSQNGNSRANFLAENLRSSQVNTSAAFTHANAHHVPSSFLNKGVLGTINSNLNYLQKEIREMSAHRQLANQVTSLSSRNPQNGNGDNKKEANQSSNTDNNNQQLFSYSPDKQREKIFSPDRLAGRLNSFPNTQFVDFEFHLGSKTSQQQANNSSRITLKANGNSNKKANKSAVRSSSSNIRGLDQLRIQIETAGRAQQQQQGLVTTNTNTSKLLNNLAKKQEQEVSSFLKLSSALSSKILPYKNK